MWLKRCMITAVSIKNRENKLRELYFLYKLKNVYNKWHQPKKSNKESLIYGVINNNHLKEMSGKEALQLRWVHNATTRQ